MFKNTIATSPLLNVSLYIVAWAVQIFISKVGFLEGAQVFTFTFQAYITALIFLSIIVLPRHWKRITRIPFSVLCLLFIANAIFLGLGGLLSQAGIQLTSAVNAGFLMQFTTVSTTL